MAKQKFFFLFNGVKVKIHSIARRWKINDVIVKRAYWLRRISNSQYALHQAALGEYILKYDYVKSKT